MKKTSSTPLGLYVIGIAALFIAGFLMLVIFGAQTYRNTVGSQNDNNRARATLSYISAAVRSSDTAGAVRITEEDSGDGTQAPVLRLADHGTGYEIRIYQYQGKLMEEYVREDAPFDPSAGTEVGETRVFEAQKDGSILRVETDDGNVFLHLRAEQD